MNANAQHKDISTPHSANFISLLRTGALAVFACSLAFAQPSFAASTDTPEQPKQAAEKQAASPANVQKKKMDHSPEAMAQHVEERIKALHQKLGITKEQEPKWGDVAQTMRENEATISALIETRRKNAENMTAIDDLQSFGAIAQAHADGIQKMIASFQSLYADMSDDQKKCADKAFGHFEGHRGHSSDKKN